MGLYLGWTVTLATGLLPIALLTKPGQRGAEQGEAQWAAVSACLLEIRTPVQEKGGSRSSNTQGNSSPETSLAWFDTGERPHV